MKLTFLVEKSKKIEMNNYSINKDKIKHRISLIFFNLLEQNF